MKAVDLRAGERVLDVAAGNGNATLAAARRFASVTSTDYVPGAPRARAPARRSGGLRRSTFEVADAEALPYRGRELRRGALHVRRHVRARPRAGRGRADASVPAGRPDRPGVLDARRASSGSSFTCVGRVRAADPGRAFSALVGTDAHIQDLFAGAATIAHTPRHFAFRYRSPEHWVDVFRTYYGPVHKAFAALDAERQAALEADLIALLRRADRGGAGRPRGAGENTWRP